MTFTIAPFIVIPFRLGSLMGWNDNLDAVFSQPIDKLLRGIASIGNQAFKVKAINQNQSLGDVVSLPGSQAQPQGIAQTIDGNMDFGAEATATASQRLIRLLVTFFVRLLRKDERGQGGYQSSHFPDRDQRQSRRAFAPTPLVHTSLQNAYKPYSIFRTHPVANAIVIHFGSSISRLQQSADTFAHLAQYSHSALFSRNFEFLPIAHQSVLCLS
jgi:hypothetical protein